MSNFSEVTFENTRWLPGVNEETLKPDGSVRVYGTWKGVSNSSGKSFSVDSYHYFEVKDGKISQERLEEINQRTRDGGAEIVKYLQKGSAFYAPAASGVQMAEAYLKDEKKLLPCAVQLNGEYGVNKVYAGVPVIIGKDGVEKIEEIDLDDKEKKEFMHSIDAVKKLWLAASKIDPDLSK